MHQKIQKIIKEKYQKDFVNKIIFFNSQENKKIYEKNLKEINFTGKALFLDEKIDENIAKNANIIINFYKKNGKKRENIINFLAENGILIDILEKNNDFLIIKNEIIDKKFLENLEKELKKEKNLDKNIIKILKNLGKKIKIIPKKTDIFKKYKELLDKNQIKKSTILEKVLIRKKRRTLSGILPITLLTKPFPCPGDCIFCPDDKKMPKSYLSEETASQRALRQNFNPFRQVKDRLNSAEIMGHNTEKIEIIILGGTFPSYPEKYQKEFVEGIFKALNGESEKSEISLENLHKKNEITKNKCVGISVEIRPDTGSDKILTFLRKLGVTKIEMGVQSLDDKVNDLNNRGTSTKAVIETTKNLRNYGFKIMYHMMLGLYGSTEKKDLKSFEELFGTKFFQPDQLKIYPCLLIKGTKLAKIAEEKKYKPYSSEKIIEIVKKIKKKYIPFYTRIARITRDIPSFLIENGSKKSNIREEILGENFCKCIRCREIKGEKFKSWKLVKEKIELNGAFEYYLEIQSEKGKCIGMLRLYFPEKNESDFKSLEKNAIIRELHVYGKTASIKNNEKKSQHQGFGEILIKEAELLAKKYEKKGVSVISAIGTRGYYKKFGYLEKETYLSKKI